MSTELTLTGLPPPPERAQHLFQAVFVQACQPGAGEPNLAVVQEVNLYHLYVRQLAVRLEMESRRLAMLLQDELALKRMAQELQSFEERRHQLLKPFLGEVAGQVSPTWGMMQNRLRDAMAGELEAVRDARLRLEVRQAELINQHAAPQVRILLHSGAQVRLFFGQRARGDATEKG